MSEAGRILCCCVSFFCVLEAVEKCRNGNGNKNNGTDEVCPFESFGILGGILGDKQTVFVLVFRGYAGCYNRNKDSDNTCAKGARKSCDCQHLSANLGVVCHRGGKTPVRNVRNRVYHAPQNIYSGDNCE